MIGANSSNMFNKIRIKSINNHLCKYFIIFVSVFAISFGSIHTIKAAGNSLVYNNYTVKWVYDFNGTMNNGLANDSDVYYIDMTISFDDYYSGIIQLNHTSYAPAYVCIGAQVTSNTSNALQLQFTNINQIVLKFVFSNHEYQNLADGFVDDIATLIDSYWINYGTNLFTFTSSTSTLSLATRPVDILDALEELIAKTDDYSSIISAINAIDDPEDFSAIISAINSLDNTSDVSSILDNLEALNSLVEKLAGDSTLLETSNYDTLIEKLVSASNEKLDSIGTLLTALTAATIIDDGNGNTTNLNVNMDSNLTDILDLLESLIDDNQLASMISQINSNVATTKNNISLIENYMSSTNGIIDDINYIRTYTKNAKESLSNVESKLTSISNTLTSIKANTDTIISYLSDSTSALTSIVSRLVTLNSLDLNTNYQTYISNAIYSMSNFNVKDVSNLSMTLLASSIQNQVTTSIEGVTGYKYLILTSNNPIAGFDTIGIYIGSRAATTLNFYWSYSGNIYWFNLNINRTAGTLTYFTYYYSPEDNTVNQLDNNSKYITRCYGTNNNPFADNVTVTIDDTIQFSGEVTVDTSVIESKLDTVISLLTSVDETLSNDVLNKLEQIDDKLDDYTTYYDMDSMTWDEEFLNLPSDITGTLNVYENIGSSLYTDLTSTNYKYVIYLGFIMMILGVFV